mgnify:CR=1 FL=1
MPVPDQPYLFRTDLAMSRIEDYPFPTGLHLLTKWQAGDKAAHKEMTAFFDNAIAGRFDADFSVLAAPDRVHSTASVHMLGLAILHDLYGIESWAYYNTCLLYTSPSPRD